MDQLVSDSDYDDLPEDDEQCFASFTLKITAALTEKLDDDSRSNEYSQALKSQYMAAVYSVALECGITTIPNPEYKNVSKFYETFNLFELAVQAEIARIRIRGRRSLGATSVYLLDNTKTKIRHHLSSLRALVVAADLPTSQKQALDRKIEELVQLLEERRLNLGKVMVALGKVAAVLVGATTLASEGPAAITHIQSAITAIIREIGKDKMSEDTATMRLTPPPKAIPAPQPMINEVCASGAGEQMWDAPAVSDIDNDIPF